MPIERPQRRPRPSYSRTRSGRRVNIGVSTTSVSSKIAFSCSASVGGGDAAARSATDCGIASPIRSEALGAAREPVGVPISTALSPMPRRSG